MGLAACTCATHRGPRAEPRSNRHRARGSQQPTLRLRNLSPSREFSPNADTDVTAACTNSDVPEDPAPTLMLSTFLSGMEVLNVALCTTREIGVAKIHTSLSHRIQCPSEPAGSAPCCTLLG